ncbi:hypothetical protein SLEP1_g40835 [Rubroshorea leprosula]|uniref:DUF7792 domain-containing protein n=1 Tax=Rubroshorea leprosula TaxID=152421 RepID=A0AAV5L4N0_9ROSI|nr:hypothetical protein SLEP1_g40835 [Rubroshorea leprosula]
MQLPGDSSMGPAEEKVREEEVMVANQISMVERVNSAVAEANSFRKECNRVGYLVGTLKPMFQNLNDYIAGAQILYERPIVCIVAEVSKNLERALALVRKCKRWTRFRRFVIGNRTTDFSRIFTLLESSIANLNWLLNLFDPYTGCATGEWNLSLPPIAIHDPVLSWVWSFITTLKMGKLKNRIEAANNLASLAQVNERNKRIIEKEGGIPLLVKLLRDTFPPEAQIAAANALYILSDDQERVRAIMTGGGIPAIVHLLRASPIRVQIQAASLVARLAEKYPQAQEAFAEEHVVAPLVKLLSFELSPELLIPQFKHKQSIYSVYEMNKKINKHNAAGLNSEIDSRYTNLFLNWLFEGSNRAKMQKKEWETAKPEVKLQLKLNCSKALWVLARENESISKNITERNGLMCLAKLIEKERNELQLNCLMIVKEIAATAEQQANFRRSAFKTNLPGVRAVIDELLRVIKESADTELQILAIRSIGSMARIFPVREIRVIESLVAQIRNKHHEVAEEAVITLQKFVCGDNFLRSEHSNSIIELNGVPVLMRLIGKASQQAKVLLGYLYDSQTLERCLCTEMEEKIGSARWTNSKASSIGPNMEPGWSVSESKTKFPDDLLRFTTVIGPCSCTCSGLLFILAKLNKTPDFQEHCSWFSSLFATGLYKECILKMVWRGISFEALISLSANTLSFQIRIETSRNSRYNYWGSVLTMRTISHRIRYWK